MILGLITTLEGQGQPKYLIHVPQRPCKARNFCRLIHLFFIVVLRAAVFTLKCTNF